MGPGPDAQEKWQNEPKVRKLQDPAVVVGQNEPTAVDTLV